MTASRFRWLLRTGLYAVACMAPAIDVWGAAVVAGPGEAGLRAAIASARDGDTVILTDWVELEASIRIDKRLTLRFREGIYHNWVSGSFTGALFQVAADGIAFESFRLYGSPQTDGLLLEKDLVLRDCSISECRHAVSYDFWFSPARVRAERVTVTRNRQGLDCAHLGAKDSIFSFNGGNGAAAWTGTFEGCQFENNGTEGLILTYGTVKNCVFRFNSGFGLWFDPDPGFLNLSGSLFYANAGGAMYLGEQAVVTVDNCTITRHTGQPAIVISQADDVLFRHCTVADNVVIGSGDPWTWPYHPPGATIWNRLASQVELQNCLVADNPTDESPHASGLVGDWIDGGGNVLGVAANLGTLRDNGGPTLSLLPLPGSPAIDAARPGDLVIDARGLSRQAGAAPDAGAIEAGAAPPADTDADGLPDIWERFRGLDPANATDASSDRDADGQTALAEFHSCTDPADPQSVHRMTQILISTPPILQPDQRTGYVTWEIQPGAMYELESSADLREWRRVRGPYYPSGRHNGRSGTMYHEVRAASVTGFFRVIVKGRVSE